MRIEERESTKKKKIVERKKGEVVEKIGQEGEERKKSKKEKKTMKEKLLYTRQDRVNSKYTYIYI